MGTIKGMAVYTDAYDYADTDTNNQANSTGSSESADLGDLGDFGMEEDLYTEIYSDVDYYESEAEPPPFGNTKNQKVVGALDEGEVGGEEAEAYKNLAKQIENLGDEIQKGSYPQEIREDLLTQLDRAKASLDIHPDQIEPAEETFLEVQDQFTNLSRHTPKALEIALNFQKEPEEIESMAAEVGLDLEHLPNPPDERVMRLLNAMGIPGEQKAEQFKILKDQRIQNMKALKTSLEAQSQIPDQDGKKPIDQVDLNMTEAYRSLQDPEYQQMMGVVGEIRDPILEGLKKLGYQATEGENFDQIVVGGTTLDFFDENTASTTLSTVETTLTQNENEFFTMPEAVDTDAPVWLDATGRVVGGVLGGTAGAIVGGMTMIPGASIVGAAVGAYVGEELGHSIVQGVHDLFN